MPLPTYLGVISLAILFDDEHRIYNTIYAIYFLDTKKQFFLTHDRERVFLKLNK